MDDKIIKINIHLIDGVDTLVPVDACVISDNTCKILSNSYLDINDFTSVWEFFPSDVVLFREDDGRFVATQLIESKFPNRKMYTLIFKIIRSLGQISPENLVDYKVEIAQLLSGNFIVPQASHPMIREWIKKYNLE
jgi:hypothetical protein